jgi:SAM-dependent methyltransferase
VSGDELRTTFEQVPELYDRIRPAYPAELLDDLVTLARIPPGGRVLELGPGTGQATLPLAERGFSITAVELGPRLAAIARRNLERFPNVEIVEADFEVWEPEQTGYDAVVAFTAFHWVAPELRYAKPARLLQPGGALAVVETEHVRDDDPFWLDVEEDYNAVVPDPAYAPSPLPEEVGDLRAELEANGFVDVEVRRYLRSVTYTAGEYRALLESYSPNIARASDTTRRLLDRVQARVVARPGGRITKPYLFVLNVGRVARG